VWRRVRGRRAGVVSAMWDFPVFVGPSRGLLPLHEACMPGDAGENLVMYAIFDDHRCPRPGEPGETGT
ncbi:hypothetical protein, partial [Jiangella ureilytica]|uniref:hypothetical protein n=1 Tax=Jiangella ureilytica TaxID=2530374 RepID=UPI00193EAC1F